MSPRRTGSSPVTARISALMASRTWSAGISTDTMPRMPKIASKRAATAKPRRLKPVTADKGIFQVFEVWRADYTGPAIAGATLGSLCDAFVARCRMAAGLALLQFLEPGS